ncbi:MAG: hypothetical protein LC776_02265 [Acidobacteria bacterium]|nr:hypothetical protein [Acidobacteriota bacterium]
MGLEGEGTADKIPADWADTVERDDGMDDGNYHAREVYANFGLAVYHAQVLEHGVVNLLTLARIFPDPTATREMFMPTMEQYFVQVFGKLIKIVTPYLGDDAELLTDLKHAVAVRNQLVHRYWREKIGLMLTTRGKNRMIAELRDTVQMFVDVDDLSFALFKIRWLGWLLSVAG